MNTKKHHSINQRIMRLVMIAILPIILIVAILLIMLVSFNSEYESTLKNVNKAAEFNIDFKENLDLAIWKYIIDAHPKEDLPWEEVYQARDVVQSLEQSTTVEDNKWRLNSMLNILNNIGRYMISIAETSGYDKRIEKMNNDVYTSTNLFTIYMHEYIYQEVQELTRLQSEISRQANISTRVIIILVVIVVIFIFIATTRSTRLITNPIATLVRKVEALGAGDFSVKPLVTNSTEIRILDDGFNIMVGRMESMLQKEVEISTALSRTEFELLQAQINPHFLYNTLDLLIWLTEADRKKEVIHMVENLSTFFRNSLSDGRTIITVGAEKCHITSYLEIQSVRYRDILRYRVDIPESISNYGIPKLTIQPLVENAIYHGIKNKRGGGTVTIEGRVNGDDVLLVVNDDGAGMSPERLDSIRAELESENTESKGGYGIVNVHRRIQLYCGNGYGLTFESSQGEGTTVTVRIPKNAKADY
jgi:two-component system sensor histidine kinase YesM